MFGKNPVHGPIAGPELRVHSIWMTVQGEGPWAGRPAVFVRLAHCNLRCYFCDTEFEGPQVRKMTPEEVISAIWQVWPKQELPSTPRVVITGGEPLLQPLHLLFQLMPGWEVQIETAGSIHPYTEEWRAMGILHYQQHHFAGVPRLLVVCSPKTPKLHPIMVELVGAWKYIINGAEAVDEEDGLPLFSTQKAGSRQRIARPMNVNPVYLQPLDPGPDPLIEDVQEAERLRLRKLMVNGHRCAELAMKHSYRVSFQMHKFIGVA